MVVHAFAQMAALVPLAGTGTAASLAHIHPWIEIGVWGGKIAMPVMLTLRSSLKLAQQQD